MSVARLKSFSTILVLRAFEAIKEVALCSSMTVRCISISSLVYNLVIAFIRSSSAFEITDTSWGLAASAFWRMARAPSAVTASGRKPKGFLFSFVTVIEIEKFKLTATKR